MRTIRKAGVQAAQPMLLAAVLACAPGTALAQHWTFDARRVGMGAASGAQNLASQMIQEERDYRAFVVPLGLIQVLRDIDIFDPRSDQFDFVRAIEYAAAPIHYTMDRDKGRTEPSFANDVRRGTVSRDLNAYRGFTPPARLSAQGVAPAHLGGTIPVWRGAAGQFQGLYLGGGSYTTLQTETSVDPRLLEVWASEQNVYLPRTQFRLSAMLRQQAAGAATVGYRGRFALPGQRDARDGVYAALNYSYLIGVRYLEMNPVLQLDTDARGLVAMSGTASPLQVVVDDRFLNGRGRAVDVGAGVVLGRWEAGFGMTGLANRMDWRDVKRVTYTLPNVLMGNREFTESAETRIPQLSVTVPVDVRVNGGYRGDRWATIADAGRGVQGPFFHGGYERHLGPIAVRGGGLYIRDAWQPTVGVGVGFSGRMGLDVAVFGTSANAEQARKTGLAVSLRLNPRQP